MGEVELSNSYLIQQMLQSHTGKETIPANNLKMHKFCYNFILNSAAAAMLTFKYARASGQQQAMWIQNMIMAEFEHFVAGMDG